MGVATKDSQGRAWRRTGLGRVQGSSHSGEAEPQPRGPGDSGLVGGGGAGLCRLPPGQRA